MKPTQLYQNYVGVDVSKGKLDLYQSSSKEHSVIKNIESEIRNFVTRLVESNMTVLVVMEPTGGYEKKLCDALLDQGVPCAVVNPKRVRDFTRGLNTIEKNDKIDATHLAYYGEVADARLLQRVEKSAEKLRAFVKRRHQLIRHNVQEKNRLGLVHDEEVKQMIEDSISHNEECVKVLEKKIESCLSESESLREKSEILSSVAGIGKITVAVLLTELSELGSLTAKKLNKLAGVAPIVKESGKYQGTRRTVGGRGSVRKALYMSVLVGIRFNSTIRDYYKSLVKRGKATKVAMVACMRKLLGILNAMIRDRKNGERNHSPLKILNTVATTLKISKFVYFQT